MDKDFLKVVTKLFSVRFWVTLILTISFCAVVFKLIDIFAANLGNDKTLGIIKDVLMFVLGVFCGKFGDVITSYFQRTDRAEETKEKVV